MDDAQEIFGSNSLADVHWLCSLSESELDMLVSLKMLVLQRAKVIGHDELAKKFDLKMLRALGFVLMEHLKGKVKDLSNTLGLTKSTSFMDGCNLLNSDVANMLNIEELKVCIGIDAKRRPAKRSRDGMTLNREE